MRRSLTNALLPIHGLLPIQAAWRLGVEYGRQFDKLLGVVGAEFLPKLAASGDAGGSAEVRTRLDVFLRQREHGAPHAARQLPLTDASSGMKGLGSDR